MTVAEVGSLDLVEVDLFGEEFGADPHSVLHRARGRHWLARTQVGYLVLTYDAVHAILRHPDLKFASVALHGETELSATMLERSRRNLLHRHGDSHTQFRKLVSRAFTPRTVERVRPAMRAVLDELLDPVCALPGFDLACDSAAVEWKPVVGIGGPVALPLRFESGR